ncbi:hypothetical protein F441_16373 [Phytophthora nicotianae CJ01A1]|uniref:Uncharacterized protein n=6 Tax=Phytophthora nicotianae TaxID=4792 RepID=V9EQ66_PHYNI|nr:hypothetical protein F443_14320 [Phytophthora nicotianae P1569]ETM40215.1 hypothetical protein L914_13784 [Phytophthora nicotianae]ETO68954.1 hypothetical protein F444_14328 [Phytophthora nicotianae P1976]ETP07331.1 hypothetical protein F441_16373 [Phytophthora nicotianae CJ01A1]ETP38151.1 hypothetical protein F442_14167 [Phytophthora nicotianae P10297]
MSSSKFQSFLVRNRTKARAIAQLKTCVGVLLWKNWRVKQRESRLSRGLLGKRWLYPALVTDIIISLELISAAYPENV